MSDQHGLLDDPSALIETALHSLDAASIPLGTVCASVLLAVDDPEIERAAANILLDIAKLKQVLKDAANELSAKDGQS
jgi:hypothetical protein